MAEAINIHSHFVGEPMKSKSVTELPGIGVVYGQRLQENGYAYARQVLGKYLTLKEDEQAFRSFLLHTCDATPQSTYDCYIALKEWCDQYV